MGKGDKKSKRGKIILGTYGARRRRKVEKIVTKQALVQEKKVVEPEIQAPKPKKKIVTASQTRGIPVGE